MRVWVLAALGLAAALLAGCATHSGSTADCFAFAVGAPACDFEPLAAVEGVGL